MDIIETQLALYVEKCIEHYDVDVTSYVVTGQNIVVYYDNSEKCEIPLLKYINWLINYLMENKKWF